MKVFTFHPRFHELVKAGAKLQTVRSRRKRAVLPGDDLSLRAWSGRPYASKQVLLREATCWRVEPVEIRVAPRRVHVTLSGLPLNIRAVEKFVVADGFRGVADFREWWERVRGENAFQGEVIRWT